MSGWGSLLEYLRKGTPAHVILAQETHLVGPRALEASSTARKLGWTVLQAEAIPGIGLGSSGGVMILARDWLGISKPDIPFIIAPGRIVAEKSNARAVLPSVPYLHIW